MQSLDDLIQLNVTPSTQPSYAEVHVQDVYIIDSENSYIYLLYQIGNIFIKKCSSTTIVLGNFNIFHHHHQ